MVTIDALDRFVHTLSGNVFHIEFDRCGNGRLSVYADTWERILCHHAEDSANTRVFSVPLTGDAFDFDHDDYLSMLSPTVVCRRFIGLCSVYASDGIR